MTRRLHWAIAALVAVAVASGLAAGQVDADARLWALRLHLLAGAVAVVLTLVRLVRRRHGGDRRQGIAGIVHRSLIAVPLLLGLTGIATVIAGQALAPLLAGAPVPGFAGVRPAAAHMAAAWLLLVLLALHIGGARRHRPHGPGAHPKTA